MDSTLPSSRTALYQDSLTGLLTMQGWVKELPGGAFAQEGSLIAIEVAGISGVNQAYGHAAGDTLFQEAVDRARQALPPTTEFMRGPDFTFFAWLPGMNGMIAEAFVSHLRQAICGRTVTLPGGEQISPKLISAVLSVNPTTPALDALQTLERMLVRQPEFSAPPVGVQRAVSALDEMNHRLEAMRLFGRDELIEQILGDLQLPALVPVTVIVVAPPQAGKTRLLSNLLSLLDGQFLPLAEVACRPSDHDVPFTLLVGIIYRFLNSYRPELLQQRLGRLCQHYPWLPGLFPLLRDTLEPPPPPTDQAVLRQALESTLKELVRFAPHVALVHSLHAADPESLNALVAIQGTAGLGLRLIAGADPDNDALPLELNRFERQRAKVIMLPPLTEEQVLAFLQEVSPDIAQPAIATQLYQATGGLQLTIEGTLRAWVEDGLLSLNNGTWEFYPEKVYSTVSTGLHNTERELLAKAALAGPRSHSFLAAIWHVTEEQARAVVDRGRALGYLCQPDASDPSLVQFIDPDEAASMAQYLTREQRVATHAEIAALLETAPIEHTDRFLRELAYHYHQAGQAELVQPIMQVVQPIMLASAPTPSVQSRVDAERWDIPTPTPVNPDDVPLLVDAALAIRLAGVKFRLYPATSPIVRQAVQEGIQSLEHILASRPSLVIAYDGRNVAFDGQVLNRRDVQVAVRDYQLWMSQGNLRAIGIAPGVSAEELSQFLQALVLYEQRDDGDGLVDELMNLPISNIKVLSREFQSEISSSYANMSGAGYQAMPMTGGIEMLMPESGSSNAPLPMPPGYTPPPMEAPPATAAREPVFDPAAMMANPSTVDPEAWGKLPSIIERVPANARRIMMANLARWMRDQDTQMAPAASYPEGVDRLLIERLLTETDLLALRETAITAEKRLELLMQQRSWDEMIALLEPIRQRLAQNASTDVQRHLSGVLDRVGEGTALRGLIDQTIQQPGNLDRARRVVMLLGERALRPLITALKNTTVMQERVRLMQLLREFGDTQQPLLLDELRQPNPWFIYRNLLQVLEEVGTVSALPVIGEKLHHEDARVRAEAVAAAVRIGREKAASYLLQAMQDDDADVRARAVSLVGLCIDHRVLEQVLRLLIPQRLGRDEPEAVQLAACLALGQFDDEEAREALMQIIQPRLFSPFRRKSDEVRSAAVSALATCLTIPAVQDTIRQAMKDRSLVVRQTAQRIWQQFQRTSGTPAK